MSLLQNAINTSGLPAEQQAQLLTLINAMQTNNSVNVRQPTGPICPSGLVGKQGPPGPQGVPGGTPIVVDYVANTPDAPASNSTDAPVENTQCAQCRCNNPSSNVPVNNPVNNPSNATNQQVFIKTTVVGDNKTVNNANPPSATRNTENKTGTKINVTPKSVELYILYLERELERQRKFIKEAYLNPDIKK